MSAHITLILKVMLRTVGMTVGEERRTDDMRVLGQGSSWQTVPGASVPSGGVQGPKGRNDCCKARGPPVTADVSV